MERMEADPSASGVSRLRAEAGKALKATLALASY